MIRPARLSDVPEIAAVHVDAWTGVDPPSHDQRLELWNHVLGGGARRTRVWVALDELGQVIGFVAAGSARALRGCFDGELTAIYVAPPFQRLGVGRALAREALEWLRLRGIRSVMTWVSDTGEASGFFRKLGARSLPISRAVRGEVAMGWDKL